MVNEVPFGAGQVSVHHPSSATESISRTLGNSVASKVVTGVREVLSLDDRTERGENAHSTGETKESDIRKNAFCHPRRPEYNHSRKGALIQREQDEMSNEAWNGDRPGLDQAQTGPRPGINWAQTGPRPGTN